MRSRATLVKQKAENEHARTIQPFRRLRATFKRQRGARREPCPTRRAGLDRGQHRNPNARSDRVPASRCRYRNQGRRAMSGHRKMSLTFEPRAHRYFWNGKQVPNVTTVLAPLTDYSKIHYAVLDRARQEGEHMHRMVELFIHDDLDEGALPAWLKPRLAAYQKFLTDTGFSCEASEHLVYHIAHEYAGRLDLIGTMNGDISVIDIKRSLFAGPAIALQLAAYQEAENDARKRAKLPKAKRRDRK